MQIGKATITPELTESVEQALEARELIKINVLKNCVAMPGDVAALLAERTHSDVFRCDGCLANLHDWFHLHCQAF